MVWHAIIRASTSAPTFCTLLFRFACSAHWKSRSARRTSASLAFSVLCSAICLSASRHVSSKIQASRAVVACSVLSTSSLIASKIDYFPGCGVHVVLWMVHLVLLRQYILLRAVPYPPITTSINLWSVRSLVSLSPVLMNSSHDVPRT